ncbi:MAG: phosphoglycerate mutase, partial [Deltaproteobacteria bacterium]|nr:phosphoglycerate mutase [Deltaproteobacteria bacterium]
MKSVIIVGDGMSDHPVDALDGKTPLMVANKPHIDRVAREGRTGLFTTIPSGMSKGSAVANLSVLGYDPGQCYQGRAVLEAASMGVTLSPDDVAFRCNLICVDDGKIKNHSAGHISNDEAAELIKALSRALTDDDDRPISLHNGVSYRHLLVFRGGWASPEVVCAPPHDYVGEGAVDLLPTPRIDDPKAVATVEKLIDLHTRARDVLRAHPVNQTRVAAGKDPANWIWTWSPGRRPKMETLQKLYGVSGAVISAVDLVMGLGY